MLCPPDAAYPTDGASDPAERPLRRQPGLTPGGTVRARVGGRPSPDAIDVSGQALPALGRQAESDRRDDVLGLEPDLLVAQVSELGDQAVEAAASASADVPWADSGADVVQLADKPSVPARMPSELLGQIGSSHVPEQRAGDLLVGRVLHGQPIHQLLADRPVTELVAG